MPKITDPITIPLHTPILVCPTCGIHTDHMMLAMDSYRCLVCGTVCEQPRTRSIHQALEPMFCPSGTCRRPGGSLFWPAVNGRRQCRFCLGWIEAAA